jgi:hypothetical protein
VRVLLYEYDVAQHFEPKVRRTYERRAKKLDIPPWGLPVSNYFKGKNLLEKG